MKRIILLSVLLLTTIAGTILSHLAWQLYHPDTIRVTITPPRFPRLRTVYPFSVIPGGVEDSRDLSETIQRDPVARRHYQGIEPARLQTVRLNAPVLAYVSFRQGNSVRWTSKKISVPKGELVLTDGKNLVRARCGNRMSVKGPKPADEIEVATGGAPKREIPAPLAEAPVSAPPEFVFETPVPSLGPPSIAALPPIPSSLLPASTTSTPLMSLASNGPSGNIPSRSYSPPPPPDHKVPEPTTFALLISGAGATFLAGRLRRRK
jgi:hypothetical protein